MFYHLFGIKWHHLFVFDNMGFYYKCSQLTSKKKYTFYLMICSLKHPLTIDDIRHQELV